MRLTKLQKQVAAGEVYYRGSVMEMILMVLSEVGLDCDGIDYEVMAEALRNWGLDTPEDIAFLRRGKDGLWDNVADILDTEATDAKKAA